MDIIGVIHLLPLPASPKGNQLSTVIERVVADARALESAGVRKAIVEKFWRRTIFIKTMFHRMLCLL